MPETHSQRVIIDVHAHAFVSPWQRAFGKATGRNIDSIVISGRPLPDWTAEWHRDAMDENSIAASVLSLPTGSSFLTGGEAKSLARAINESFAEVIARYPGRFGAFAVVPFDDIEAAIRETEYALDVLKLDGVSSDTHYKGKYLGDPYFYPWLAELNRRSATLFVHPTIPPGSEQCGIGLNVAVLEFMFDTTRMVANMVTSGAKRRFFDVKIISTHGGGTIPYLASRISILAPLIGSEAGESVMSPAELMSGMGSFYYDLTASTAAASLDAIRRLVPPAQLLMGFDFPMMPTSTIAPAMDRFNDYEHLTKDEKHSILHDNAARLFPRLAQRTTSQRTR